MALEIFVQGINQKKSQAEGGKENQLNKYAVANTASDLCGSTMSAKNFVIIQARQTPEPGVPRVEWLDRGSRFLGGIAHGYLTTTHSKVIFISSLVTILPVGSLGEGGLIPKSVIFKFALPWTTN